MSDTITLSVYGEEMEVEIYRMGKVERMRWQAIVTTRIPRIPEDPDDFVLTEDILNFFLDAIPKTTSLNRRVAESIDMQSLGKVMTAVAQRIAGLPIDVDDDEKGDSMFDFNDNGTVNLDDWR